MLRLARFFVQNRWLVIGSWIVFIAVVQGLAAGAGGADYRDVFSLPGSESQQVFDLLDAQHRSAQAGQTGTIVVHARIRPARPEPAAGRPAARTARAVRPRLARRIGHLPVGCGDLPRDTSRSGFRAARRQRPRTTRCSARTSGSG